MDDFTRKFSLAMEKDAEIHQILSTVYQALEERAIILSIRSLDISFRKTLPILPIITMPAR